MRKTFSKRLEPVPRRRALVLIARKSPKSLTSRGAQFSDTDYAVPISRASSKLALRLHASIWRIMRDEAKKPSATVELRPEERRKHARYPFSAAAEVFEPQSNTRVTGRCSDLARGGCFIDAMSPFPVGTSVAIFISFDQKKFEAKGRVVYSQSGMGMGLEFTSVGPDQRWILEQWISELSGQPPAKLKVIETERAPEPDASGNDEPRYVLNELIITLMRKGVLTDKEGKTLLLKLMS